MANFQFELVSPERILFSGPVEQVVVPGEDGDMTILASHAPVMTTLRAGVLSVTEAKGAALQLYVRGGFADVTAQGLTILADQAIPTDEIDHGKLATDIRNAEDDVRDAKADDVRRKAEARLRQLRTMQGVLKG